jgi:hypothetical protein
MRLHARPEHRREASVNGYVLETKQVETDRTFRIAANASTSSVLAAIPITTGG